MNANCPHCRRFIEFTDVSGPEHTRAGLVYLSTNCSPCNARIEVAGIGLADAEKNAREAIAKRVGTSPEQWKIKIRPQRRKKWQKKRSR